MSSASAGGPLLTRRASGRELPSMRLPSPDRLIAAATASLRRFPAVIVAAALATVAGLALIESPERDVWIRLMAVATLALPATFSASITADRRGWGVAGRLAALALVAAVLAGFFFALEGWTDEVRARRYLQLSAGFHLAAAFLPFLGFDETRGFWQYNRALFLRFLTAGLYAVVLQLGLSLAIGALDQLFGVPIPDETYLRLWVVLGFLFLTWFFLAGIPEDVPALETMENYPKGLKLFTQHVLVPLVVVYLAILTAYAVKVVMTWDWPSGWIGWLVSVVAVVGILAYLLVHPVRRAAENRWIRIYGRWFWVAILPAVVLLALAVYQRVAQYGVTEDRYFLGLGTVWLGAVALYYALTRSSRIERIPQTLCLVMLLTFLGPWSAYAVSERSQLGRLQRLLARNDMLAEGGTRPAPRDVSFEDRKEISATVRYLVQHSGEESLQPLFGSLATAPRDAAARSPDSTDRRSDSALPEEIVSALGIRYVDRWEGARGRRRYLLHADGAVATGSISGFDRVVRNVTSTMPDTVIALFAERKEADVDGSADAGLDRSAGTDSDGSPGSPAKVRIVADSAALRLLPSEGEPLTLSVLDLAERLGRGGTGRGSPVPADSMWIRAETGGLRAALWLEQVTVGREPGSEELAVHGWQGLLLIGGAGR